MQDHHSQILALLADGRISVSEAERLLALTGVSASAGQKLLNWIPAAALGAFLFLRHSAALDASLQFLTLRAAEVARLDHFHMLLTR